MELSILEICKELEHLINLGNNKNVSIEFFSGLKPSNYFIPDIQIGRNLEDYDKKDEQAWFCEIFVNKKCIIRECYIHEDENKAKDIAEYKVAKLLLFHGINTLAKEYVQL